MEKNSYPPKSDSNDQSKRRSRIKFACYRCRQQRRKCDGKNPCGNCINVESICVYPTDNDRKPLSRKYVKSLLNEIEALKSYEPKQYSGRTGLNDISAPSQVARLLKSSKLDIKNLVNVHDVFTLDLDCNGLLTFHGPTTNRHMSVPPVLNFPIRRLATPLVASEARDAAFKWFFENINTELPFIDENLFFDSVRNYRSHSISQTNYFVSDALVNSIMAISLSRHGDPMYRDYKKMAAVQVMDTMDLIHVTQVQALLILSILEMSERNETRASCYHSMACSLCQHLGLHLAVNDTRISNNEKILREKIFWSCFIIDRTRYLVLGIGLTFDMFDVSTKLTITSHNDNLLLIREFCTLLDIAIIGIRCIYSLQSQMVLCEENRKRQVCACKDTEAKLLRWEVELPPICRLINDSESHPNRSLLYLIHIFYHTAIILIYKPFTSLILIETTQHHMVNASIAAIKLCEKINFHKCALKYFALFSLYISCICCMFFSCSKKIRANMHVYIKTSVRIFIELKKVYPIAEVYYERIKVVKLDWKLPFTFEDEEVENEFEAPNYNEIDFAHFLWPYEPTNIHEREDSLADLFR